MIVSEKIFSLLQEKGMSQKEFSERTGISQSTISDWKRKKTNPSVDKVLKICEVLQISPYELLDEEESLEDEGSVSYDIVLSRDEKMIVECYRNFASAQRERLLGYLNALKDIK